LDYPGGCRCRGRRAAGRLPAPEVLRLADTAEFLGRIEAFQKVQVRARVTGMIDEVPFHKGDVLFRIDLCPDQARLDQAEASLRQKQE